MSIFATRRVRCPRCAGTGHEPTRPEQTCLQCDGRKTVVKRIKQSES